MKMTFQDAVKFFKSCSKEELQRVSEVILSMISGEASTTNELMVKEREIICPECGSVHWVRNGHSPTGIQHYKCKDCGKAFSSTTNTILQNTHMPLSIWKKYIGCMVVGMSIRKTAEVCDINNLTAFLWRHKILDAIAKYLDQQKLEGKIEADETFFRVSYKGNHSKSTTFVMPREPHKRGNSVHKRGLSREQVCVPCAIAGKVSVGKVASLGNASIGALRYVFDGRFEEGSFLTTDGKKGYEVVAAANGATAISASDRKYVQKINSYHSLLKRFMYGFRGVSTKYLNNYMTWHNFVTFVGQSISEFKDAIPKMAFTLPMYERLSDISSRANLPVAA